MSASPIAGSIHLTPSTNCCFNFAARVDERLIASVVLRKHTTSAAELRKGPACFLLGSGLDNPECSHYLVPHVAWRRS